MNPDFRNFFGSLTRVLLPVILAIATTAFVCIPMTPGHMPGEGVVARVSADFHMT